MRSRELCANATQRLGAPLGIVWGTPVALSFALALESALPMAGGPLALSFWLALLAGAGAGARFADIPRYRCLLRGLTAVLLAAALAIHYLQNAGAFDSPAAHAVSLAIASLSLAFGLAARPRSTRGATSREARAEKPPAGLARY